MILVDNDVDARRVTRGGIHVNLDHFAGAFAVVRLRLSNSRAILLVRFGGRGREFLRFR